MGELEFVESVGSALVRREVRALFRLMTTTYQVAMMSWCDGLHVRAADLFVGTPIMSGLAKRHTTLLERLLRRKTCGVQKSL